ncbi:hypothetical protein Tco_0656479 [Tanacetum coccineum]|uniref:Uncharacterized protein n=1 Tax=Tanacetum coccineum TaxID=301880 RepID=A0ABQ4X8V7_9ASTR
MKQCVVTKSVPTPNWSELLCGEIDCFWRKRICYKISMRIYDFMLLKEQEDHRNKFGVTNYVNSRNCVDKVIQVMAASTIPVSAEENLGDPIDIRVDIIHPEPVAAVAFPAAAIVRTQAQHGEAIRGIQEHLLGVPIQEELTALRFRADIAEAENASLRARIKTTEAIGKITRNRERQARVKIEQQLAAVQESQRQDREDFRKLKELMTSQFGRHS